MNAPTKEKIQMKCKIRGYNIKIEALDEIIPFVTRFEPAEQDEAIDLVLDQLENESRNLSLSQCNYYSLDFLFDFVMLKQFFTSLRNCSEICYN
jgi:hypothetical protein